MAFLRIDTRPLFPWLRAELATLLAGLSSADWASPTACPGWSVHAVAAHLLGVELGNVSVRRDGWALGPAGDEDLDTWLNAFNQQWVDAARRISPALLIDLLDLAGRRFEEHVATLDPDAMGGPVQWATGSEAAPVWLDVGREYMERYVHQMQIRDATGRPALGVSFTSPVLAVAAHALPRALDGVMRPAGTVATFSAEGEGGGAWRVVCAPAGWELESASAAAVASAAGAASAAAVGSASLVSASAAGPGAAAGAAACHVRTTVDDAIKLYIRSPGSVAFRWEGDHELAEALFGAKAILG